MREAIVALLAASLACGQPARLVEPAPQPTPWCVSISAEQDGVTHATRACLDTYALCLYVRERAITFAGLAHFTAVGSCHVEASR